MVKLTEDEWVNFWDYYNGKPSDPHQEDAIRALYAAMPDSLLMPNTEWVQIYRNPPDQPAWPVSKQQLAVIMQCSVSSLPDSLMDDLARASQLFQINTPLRLVYFLGQVGHESAGLRYPMEIHDGSNYEGRQDLGNTKPGDGVKFAGTGWIQVTGRYNHQSFSDFLRGAGTPDPMVMDVGKTYTSEVYPWSISGHWWLVNQMNSYCDARPDVTNHQIDQVGARVNGRMRPNGADDRLAYTGRAYRELIS